MIINKNDKKIFTILQRVAEAMEPAFGHRLAAAVVFRGEVISIGYNKTKSHPFAQRFGKNERAIYFHAETDAIKNALRHISVDDLAKCTLYVQRVKRPDSQSDQFVTGMAKPCSGCQRAIDTFGIKKVYFSTDSGYDVL